MISARRAVVLTATLDRAMVKVVRDAKLRDELAFHIADILRDYLILKPVIDKAFKVGSLSTAEVNSIVSTMLVHWPYHQKGISRIMDKLDEAPQGSACNQGQERQEVTSPVKAAAKW